MVLVLYMLMLFYRHWNTQ